jgi:arylsulfatase B/arylsulfatase I/J
MQYFMVESAIPWGLELEETTIAQVLSDNGYKTHMLGKWHLGHSTPRYLPTARGFDTFTGMLNGESYYWSKRNPDHPHFKDFMSSDRECFWPYDESDMHEYSTFLYRDKAVKAIEQHDFATSPMFMYVAFQAVHDPFYDFDQFESGIPTSYLSNKMYKKIMKKVKGRKRRQYAMALSLLDDAVESIHDSLDAQGQLDNTYIIFTSDNGGCYNAGGKNGDYRGTKGSLFEGGWEGATANVSIRYLIQGKSLATGLCAFNSSARKAEIHYDAATWP